MKTRRTQPLQRAQLDSPGAVPRPPMRTRGVTLLPVADGDGLRPNEVGHPADPPDPPEEDPPPRRRGGPYRPDLPAPPDVLPEATAHRIAALMRQHNVTQKQLAAELGVTETTISRWVRRRTTVPFSMLERIATRLGTTPGQLLDAERRPAAAPGGALPAAGMAPAETWMRTEVAALREAFVELRRTLHAVPCYQWGTAGDPRGASEDEPTPIGTEYVPAGRDALVGRRGFAVRVQGESMAGRGIRDGDLVFVNPDRNYRLGSAVLARVDGRMVVKEVSLGPDGRDLLRSNPLTGPPEAVPGQQFLVIGPVVLVTSVSVLQDGLGNAGDPEGGGPPPLPFAGGNWASQTSTRPAVPPADPAPHTP